MDCRKLCPDVARDVYFEFWHLSNGGKLNAAILLL